jgi:prefoldin subunit 4
MLADDDIPVKYLQNRVSYFSYYFRYQLGECYLQVDKTEVESLLEKEEQRINSELDRFSELLAQTKASMGELKVKLYAKFGTSINLEEE